MRGKRDGTDQFSAHWVSAGLTERALRKRGALDAGEQLIEWKLGRILRWTIGGADQPVPGTGPRFDPRRVLGLCGCCYSRRGLFFGSKASLYGDLAASLFADLAVVWHVDSADMVLRVVIAHEQQPVVVWWRSGENEDAAAVAGFAARIRAQRATRLAGLPPEQRLGAESRIARLEGRHSLERLLAEPVSPARTFVRTGPRAGRPGVPRTHVGRWLMAGLLNQHAESERLKRKLNNGNETGWNYDEPAVVLFASEQAVRRFFSRPVDASEIASFVTDVRSRIHSTVPPDQLKMETLIRDALGDPDVDVSGIKSDEMFRISGVILGGVVSKLSILGG